MNRKSARRSENRCRKGCKRRRECAPKCPENRQKSFSNMVLHPSSRHNTFWLDTHSGPPYITAEARQPAWQASTSTRSRPRKIRFATARVADLLTNVGRLKRHHVRRVVTDGTVGFGGWIVSPRGACPRTTCVWTPWRWRPVSSGVDRAPDATRGPARCDAPRRGCPARRLARAGGVAWAR